MKQILVLFVHAKKYSVLTKCICMFKIHIDLHIQGPKVSYEKKNKNKKQKKINLKLKVHFFDLEKFYIFKN